MAIQPAKYRGFRVTRGDATGEQLAILVPTDYRVVHFASAADEATDWNVANPTHPTWYVHSETTPATDYIAFSHDGTDGYINSVGGTLRLNGVTSLYLSIGGTNEITLTASALSPTTSDGNALGTTALMWADLFLASGGVINLNNGNVTLTHSAGQLAFVSASLGAAVNAWDHRVTVSAPNNQSGMAAYFDVTINGSTAGHCYGVGSWINTGATSPVLSAGHIIVPFEGGVYTGEAQANARIVFGGQHQAILTGVPASLHAWRLNVAAAAGPVTALIAAANSGSVGYVANATANSTKLGDIPIADIAGGVGVVYIRVYGAQA